MFVDGSHPYTETQILAYSSPHLTPGRITLGSFPLSVSTPLLGFSLLGDPDRHFADGFYLNSELTFNLLMSHILTSGPCQVHSSIDGISPTRK